MACLASHAEVAVLEDQRGGAAEPGVHVLARVGDVLAEELQGNRIAGITADPVPKTLREVPVLSVAAAGGEERARIRGLEGWYGGREGRGRGGWGVSVTGKAEGVWGGRWLAVCVDE
jgi:hypothetical protein